MLRLVAAGYYALTLACYLALYHTPDLSPAFHWSLIAVPLAVALPLGYAFDRSDALWLLFAIPAAALTASGLVAGKLIEPPGPAYEEGQNILLFLVIGSAGAFLAGVLLLIGMYAHELAWRWR